MSKKIVGYSDKLSVAPGETVRFMVSCGPAISAYELGMVRLFCGDTQPGAPGLKQTSIPTAIDGRYAAQHQPIRAGSFGWVSDHPAFRQIESLTAQAMVYPTLLDRPRQTLLSRFDPASGGGFELAIDALGRPCLRIGDGSGQTETLTSATPLRERVWCFVAVSFDHRTGAVRFVQQERAEGLEQGSRTLHETTSRIRGLACSEAPLLIGASFGGGGTHPWGTACFNGRLERPALSLAALDADAMHRLQSGDATPAAEPKTIAVWDFSQEISSDRLIDVSGNGCHGRAVNLPIRAVRGTAWDGSEHCWRHAPSQYAAMHFLEDAIHDCGWQADAVLTIPKGLPSGFYAAHVRAGEDEDQIPFFVRPPRGRATQPLALLVPTFSYLAYANWRLPFENNAAELLMNALPVLGAEDRYLLEHPEIGPSLYDTHNDGTSACYASRFRPNLNMRPSHPWLEQYPADLLLVDWLHNQGIAHDVITDEDLHSEGAALLGRYRCVMTGTHPEYYSTPMWDGLQAYLVSGGRMMYMGGNGFVWRVGVPPGQSDTIELRRGETGSSVGTNEPGEYFLSSTGEYGGAWSKIGRAPNRLAGVGYIAQGFDFSAGYRRLADSFDPRAAFIFEGIGADEVIGRFGLQGHGAAGVEIDRFDLQAGTPRHALRLATSASGHTATYRLANLAGLDDPEIRADLVFFEVGSAGAVFSVGSMAWASALSHDGSRNNVSRITANVLLRFLDLLAWNGVRATAPRE